MTCAFCRAGETRPGEVDVPLQRGPAIVVIRRTPAQVCENCGEHYLSDEVTQRVLAQAEDAVQRGAEIEVIGYAA